jgi:CheY-like chemotaxis protein
MTSGITVLIAEDECIVRTLAAEVLSDAGFGVHEAAQASEALDILERAADDIDLLFTDINMPGSVDGLELARRVRARWPRIALLISSGAVRPIQLPAGAKFMLKPYDLEKVVAEVLTLTATNN